MRPTTRLSALAIFSVLTFALLPTSAHAASARASLDRRMPSLKFDNITLKDALDYIRDLSSANVDVNWKALEGAGVGKDAVVSMHLRDVPLRKALDVILAQASGQNDLLTYYIADNVIEITTRDLADKMMVTRVYPIDDLLVDVPDFPGPDFDISATGGGGASGSGSASSSGGSSSSIFGSSSSSSKTKTTSKADKAQEIVDLITSIIRPDVWQANGGTATIRYFNGSLIITAPRSVHEAIDGPVE